MNLFIREIKSNMKSMAIWSIGIVIMVLGGMTKYKGFSASGQSINEVFKQMPKAVQNLLGINFFDLQKVSGFYGVLFLYLVIMASIHASVIGASIIAKEERDKTAEFLLVKPISRNEVITSKLLAALFNILIFNIITLLTSIFVVGHYNKGKSINRDILILMCGMFILQLIYMLIGAGIAAVTKKPKKAASLSAFIMISTFVLSVIIDMNSNLEKLKYLTPFKYFEAKNLMYGGNLDFAFVFLSLIIIVLSLVVTYLFYKKRDLNV